MSVPLTFAFRKIANMSENVGAIGKRGAFSPTGPFSSPTDYEDQDGGLETDRPPVVVCSELDSDSESDDDVEREWTMPNGKKLKLAKELRLDPLIDRWVRLGPVAKAVLAHFRKANAKMKVLAEASGISPESLNSATEPLRDFERHMERLSAEEIVDENRLTQQELFYSGEERAGLCPLCNEQERAILIPCLHRACLTCTKKKLESQKTTCRSCGDNVLQVKLLPEEL